jgi:hypothetical protein
MLRNAEVYHKNIFGFYPQLFQPCSQFREASLKPNPHRLPTPPNVSFSMASPNHNLVCIQQNVSAAYTIIAHGGVEVQFLSVLTSALHWSKWSASRPTTAYHRGKNHRCLLNMGLGRFQRQFGRLQDKNLFPCQKSDHDRLTVRLVA